MAIETRRDFIEALIDLDRRKCEASLAHFMKGALPVLYPSQPLGWNWHIDAKCEHLEAVTAGELTRLAINEPPRYIKSTTVTVCWPVWEWTLVPWQGWLFGSYSGDLSIMHSVERRRLIESEWFQERWGKRIRLTSDQNVKSEFENTKRGRMVATSMNGTATGKGGNRIVLDDPHNPKQAESDVQRASAIDAYAGTFYNRLNDKRKGAIVLVMQRLHQNDLTGHILAEGGWTHLKLDNPCQQRTTIVLPRSGQTITRQPGDLLWPEKEGEPEIATMRKVMGAYRFAGQYLQAPSPPGGAIFKRAWFEASFYHELPAEFDEVVASIDAAFKGKADSDNTAIQIWGRKGADKYLVAKPDTEQMSFPEAKRRVKLLRVAHPRISRIYIEDKANGPAIIDDLKNEVSGMVAVNPEGGKEARAHATSAGIEAGNVHLPSPVDKAGNPRPGFEWVLDFIELAAQFPKVTHDDDIDAMTQALAQMQKNQDAWAEFVKQEVDTQRAAEAPPPPPVVVVEPEPPPPPPAAMTPEDAARALFG